MNIKEFVLKIGIYKVFGFLPYLLFSIYFFIRILISKTSYSNVGLGGLLPFIIFTIGLIISLFGYALSSFFEDNKKLSRIIDFIFLIISYVVFIMIFSSFF